MCAKQRQPKSLAPVPPPQKLRRSYDIPEALRHLLRAHVDETIVHPIARKRRAAVGAAALRDLILVVRKDEVESAAMDVDRLAKMIVDHRRTFDMPSGPAPAPGRIPADHPFRAWLPQDEIGRIAFVGSDLDPRARDHRFAIALAKSAVVGIGGDRKQQMPF